MAISGGSGGERGRSNSEHTLKKSKKSKKFFKSTDLSLSFIEESQLCQKQYTEHYRCIQSTRYTHFLI